MFAKDAVYWGTDVPYRWNRSTGAITTVLTDLRVPWFDAVQSRGWYVQFSEISTKQDDGYIGDEHVHILLGNRSSWRSFPAPWIRSAAYTQSKVAPKGVTAPDLKGCFWLSLPGLTGANGAAKNFKVCLGR